MKLDIGAASDVGRVRDANQDAYLADPPLFAIADGMGGHLAGDVASATAIDSLVEHASQASADDPETLVAIVKQANRAIFEKSRSDPKFNGMGTTCTLLLIDGDVAQLAHVGDSRAYLFRAGELTQLTEDHTLVGRMVNEGKLDAEEARHHPQRSIITRALGVDSEVDVDLLTVNLTEGDRVLMCSDGLSSMIGFDEIKRILEQTPGAQPAADALVGAANDAGGDDNITVVIIDAHEGAEAGAANDARGAEPVRSPRRDTVPRSAAQAARSRRRPRVVIVTLFVLALVAAGGYAAAHYFLDRSWFVGVSDSGFVTVYKGIPEEIAGLDLKDEEQTTSIPEAKVVPESLRERLRDGVKVDSLAAAQTMLANIQDQIRQFAIPNKPVHHHKKNGR